MIPDSATVPDSATKRKRGDIRAQLAVSAFVLLVPPLAMVAGVMHLGSPLQGAGLDAAQHAAAPQPAVAGDRPVSVAERSNMRPDGATNFALASADQRPVVTEPRPAAEPATLRPAAEQPAASAPRPASGQATSAKDSTRYHGGAPVTLVHAGTATDQPATADIEAPPSTAKAADAPAADALAAAPEQSPAAARTHPSGRKVGRHEARKPQHTPSLADIFLRPTTRPRAPRG
jgi:hypothetical protein